MQVVVAGASGFVGQAVVRQALDRGWEVFPLVRDKALPVFLDGPEAARITPVPWGAAPDTLKGGYGLEPGAWVVNCAGLAREVRGVDPHKVHEDIAREVVALAEGIQAARLVHLGPLILPTGDGFMHAKQVAEWIIGAAQVPWSVVRAAPAFGPGDDFLDELGAWMVRSPIIPRFLEHVPLQPLWVEDLAGALLNAGQGLQEVGGERVLWGDLLRRCAEAAGKKLIGPVLEDETVLRLTRTLGDRGLLFGLVPFTEAGFRRHQKGYVVPGNQLPSLLGRPARPLASYLAETWPYRHEPTLRKVGRAGAPVEEGADPRKP